MDLGRQGTLILDRGDERVVKSTVGVQKCNKMGTDLGTSHHKQIFIKSSPKQRVLEGIHSNAQSPFSKERYIFLWHCNRS
jgi:hypothetical protein